MRPQKRIQCLSRKFVCEWGKTDDDPYQSHSVSLRPRAMARA
jgi:hypothetical protein